MLHFREEGGLIRQGLNVYPRDDKFNKGFILQVGALRWWFRWSTFRQRLISHVTFV